MSISNENNRSSITAHVGAVAGTKTVVLYKAFKKTLLKKVELIDAAAVAASESVYVTAQLKKNGSNVGSLRDTKLGLAALEALTIGSDVSLVAGDVLSVTLAIASTGALTLASVCMDEHVLGS
jgi:phage-related tail protein